MESKKIEEAYSIADILMQLRGTSEDSSSIAVAPCATKLEVDTSGCCSPLFDEIDLKKSSPRQSPKKSRISKSYKKITIDELRLCFDMPIVHVARKFGVCTTLLKKICRNNGINRWPHRQIRSIDKNIEAAEKALATSANQIHAQHLMDQLSDLKKKKMDIINDPNVATTATIGISKNYTKKKSSESMMTLLRSPSPDVEVKMNETCNEIPIQRISPQMSFKNILCAL